MAEEQRQRLDVHLQEYGKLKDEQAQRIGFRDNLLYVTLALFGTVLALAIGEKANPHELLVLPWASLVLAWTDYSFSYRMSFFLYKQISRV